MLLRLAITRSHHRGIHRHGRYRGYTHCMNALQEGRKFSTRRSDSLGDDRLNLSGLNREEMVAGLGERGIHIADEHRYRLEQIFQWVYRAGERNVQNFHNLPLHLRQQLARECRIDSCDTEVERHVSSDETRKYLLQFASAATTITRKRQQQQQQQQQQHVESDQLEEKEDMRGTVRERAHGNSGSAAAAAAAAAAPPVQVECVFIPETSRGTMCVSSQVGCSLSCKFCHTGSQALERNLKSWEIVNQVMHAKHDLQDFAVKGKGKSATRRRLTNVVFMGQGEPAYNYREVKKAIDILTDPAGLCIPARRIVVSTSGVVPILERLATELPQVQIAISLHATTDELRNELVPINKTYPMDILLERLREISSEKSSRQVTIEYVMLKGVNDSFADANRLLELLRGVHATVNLIPFNSWPGSEFESSDDEHIIAFSAHLYKRGLKAPIRWSRGDDILGACGQLRSTNRLKQSFIKRLGERQRLLDLNLSNGITPAAV